MARAGMLLQIDGSRHDWLEGRGPWLSLVGGIDDATGVVPWAIFREREDAQGYFQLLREVVRRYGIPLAVYSDQHTIFFANKKHMTLAEQLSGHAQPTQFGRLLEELGVRLIRARSPQAKGRVERLWGTFQDRLCSELRLAGATTREEANLALQRFLPRHNRRFSVAAADPETAYVPWPKQRPYHEAFCFKYRRVVGNDNTVQFGKLVIDLPPRPHRNSAARLPVEVHQRFDGSVHVFHDGVELASSHHGPLDLDRYRLGTNQRRFPSPPRPPRLTEPPPSFPTVPWRDPTPHPWRRYPSVASRPQSLNG